MKVKSSQPTLCFGSGGKILIDSTNLKAKDNEKLKGCNSKKRKLNEENLEPNKVFRKDGIYVDVSSPAISVKKFADAAAQTDPDMTVQDTEENWKELAEKRREALEITLAENEVLFTENQMLKKDNKVLEEICESAKHLAQLVDEKVNNDTDEPLEEADNEEEIL